MSARGGLTNRSDLFSARSEEGKESKVDDAHDPRERDRQRRVEQYGVGEEDSDPLQLEHMLGYSGEFKRTVLMLPFDENSYIKRYSDAARLDTTIQLFL